MPNILLVVLDTLTAAAAGMGGTPVRMPALARLAEGGLWFRHAVSNAPWTVPAHASLFTGLLPSQHLMDGGNQFLVWDRERRPRGGNLVSGGARTPRTDPELAERWLPAALSRAGYETVAASNNPWVGRLTHMEHGFHLIRDTLSVRLAPRRRLLRWAPQLRSLSRASYHTYRAVTGRGDLLAAEALDRLRDWRSRRDRTKPFFLFLNLIEAHAPYLTPLAARAVRSVGGGTGSTFRAMRLIEPRQTIRYNIEARPDPRLGPALGVLQSLHCHAARYLDTIVEHVIAVCGDEERGMLMCVTSDHGESFGDHGALLHGFTLQEDALHIPLVLAGDGVASGEVDTTVGLRDVYQTLLDAAGASTTVGSGPSLLKPDGLDVVAQRDRAHLPSWAQMGDLRATERTGRMTALYRDPWKLVWVDGSTPSLYDLSRDPTETVDLAQSRPEVVASLAASLPPWPEPSEDLGVIAQERAAGVEDGERELTRREEDLISEQLAALGYLE